jgi:hypothetical protein
MEGYLLIAAFVAIVIWGFVKNINTEPPPTPKIGCPHCGMIGHVTVTEVDRKQGLSGGKATAGLLTGGASLFAVGLSRKQKIRHLSCSNCSMEWDVA